MRTHKAILHDAVRAIRAIQAVLAILAIRTIRTIRTVRHTFSGSMAGRAAILAVLVGAAAAYGMPEWPSAPTPVPSIVNFNVRFANANADAALAGATASTAQGPSAAQPLPIEPPLSGVVAEQPLVSAPMVSEAPKPAEAPVLARLPQTGTVAETPKPATSPAPIQLASLGSEPAPDEFPKSVAIHLPMPKPPLSPAQRLELHGKDYDKAERCLAQAIYFEARNEPARGQQAVAQVVLNRVFSPYYPKDVCSVVYQNAHRHLSCQFTFACDGKAERVSERGAWARANRIAMQTLNARVWLPEVNKATHYHAAYVRPNWIRDMKVMVRYGLHIFYRPRNWGDGAKEVQWGTASNSVKPAAVAAKPAAARKRWAKRIAPRRAHVRHYRVWRGYRA